MPAEELKLKELQPIEPVHLPEPPKLKLIESIDSLDKGEIDKTLAAAKVLDEISATLSPQDGILTFPERIDPSVFTLPEELSLGRSEEALGKIKEYIKQHFNLSDEQIDTLINKVKKQTSLPDT